MSRTTTVAERIQLEKLLEAEDSVGKSRLFIVLCNVTWFLFFIDHGSLEFLWLTWSLSIISLVYAAGVVLFKPFKRFPLLLSSAFTTLTDSLLVGFWLAATGWAGSPFYPLWYVSIIAVAIRYSRKETALVALAYLIVDMAVIFTDSTVEVSNADIVIRAGYLIGMAILGSFISRSVERHLVDKVNLSKTQEKLQGSNKNLEEQVQRRTAKLKETTEDLLDSMKYAQRIQMAITPTDSDFSKCFKDHFIYCKPKELIGGDFYWVHDLGKFKLVAMVDCTGHGVPGAMLAVMGMNLLERIVIGQNQLNPSKILSWIDEYLSYSFTKYQTNVNLNDGMVASICLIDTERNTVRFAGANQSIMYAEDSEVREVRSNRLSLGGQMDGAEKKEFEESEFEVKPGSSLYLYCDGYVDQFGGPKDKKFLKKRLLSLIESVQTKPMSEQRDVIRDTFVEWKGDNPQVDDVTVIGIQL